MIMNILALVLAISLLGLAVVHFVWGIGSSWPYSSEQQLAKAVVGQKDIEKMPSSLACFGVSICLLIAAAISLLLRLDLLVATPFPRWLVLLGGVGAGIVFLGRGIFGVMPAMEKLTPEQPFLRLNRFIYSPLCILLGVGFTLLVIAYPNWSWRLSSLF